MDFARAIAVWHSVGRRVSAHRRLVAAALTGLAVFSGLNAVRPSVPVTRPIWVAAHDLPSGEPLVAADLRSEQLPLADIPRDALAATTPVSGRLLAAPMRAGEPLTDLRLLTPSLLSAGAASGDVAVPVRVSDGPATLALVEVGDEVDIIASADPADGEPGPAPNGEAAVIRRVRILAVPSHAGSGLISSDGSADDLAGVLIVAATPAQATALANAATSARLTVALQDSD